MANNQSSNSNSTQGIPTAPDPIATISPKATPELITTDLLNTLIRSNNQATEAYTLLQTSLLGVCTRLDTADLVSQDISTAVLRLVSKIEESPFMTNKDLIQDHRKEIEYIKLMIADLKDLCAITEGKVSAHTDDYIEAGGSRKLLFEVLQVFQTKLIKVFIVAFIVVNVVEGLVFYYYMPH